jgi:hypothetical protein
MCEALRSAGAEMSGVLADALYEMKEDCGWSGTCGRCPDRMTCNFKPILERGKKALVAWKRALRP